MRVKFSALEAEGVGKCPEVPDQVLMEFKSMQVLPLTMKKLPYLLLYWRDIQHCKKYLFYFFFKVF